MPAARFIGPLTDDECETVRMTYRHTEVADLRTRCQMMLLSASGRRVPEIAAITLMNADTIVDRFDRYGAAGLDGLVDRPRSGRPPKSESTPAAGVP